MPAPYDPESRPQKTVTDSVLHAAIRWQEEMDKQTSEPNDLIAAIGDLNEAVTAYRAAQPSPETSND